MTGGDKPSLRDRLFPLLTGRLADLRYRQASNFVARRLLREGTEMWSGDPHLVQEAIDKIERAWALSRDPKIAIQLATMYDRANRNDEALAVLRKASHDNPRHALLRHHAAITLLRHGAPGEIREFFESVQAIDPEDAFARFIMTVLELYDGWAARLAGSIERRRDGRQPFLISLPVWGEMYSAYCVRYLCAALLSPNNLPALARSHSVHVAIFTTEETEKGLRANPLFRRLAEHATIDFVHYGADLVNYGASMEACYGHEEVYYSENPLAFYYARNCKFVLMSCAHYAALAAGRMADALVSCMIADTILNDGALPRLAAHMAEADAVLVHSIQLHGKEVRPILDGTLRGPDGILHVSPESCDKLVVEQIPEANFSDARRFADPPLRIAWRVGRDGVLVHANHYHPFCLRPKALAHPLGLSIDPVDSRFVDRASLDLGRIHVVQDSSITALSIDDDPILEPSENSMGALSVSSFALWLWGYWGPLRGRLFHLPIRFGAPTPAEEWQRVERSASATIDAIVDRAAGLEAAGQAGKSWRVGAGSR